MIINEIFYCLQGEGKLAGTPSALIRLAGCPLRCRWCDTKYACPTTAGQPRTPEQILTEISEYPTRHAIVTGGEPLAQQDTPHLLQALEHAGMHVTIETCGIHYHENIPCDLMSISPKLSNSTPDDPELASPHDAARLCPEILQKLIDNYDYQLKFVVDTPADLDEIAELLDSLNNVNPYKVFFMPQASTRDEYLQKSQLVAQICEKTGFKMSQRLHILLYDGQKGR
ncbi:7-carboxy-7-deazaguanine synthase [Anaerohalosphaera lusitana]|uniref:7-carboxy-7-deazaguanine synthase n=1 Tax=Anaerohalosphaera lusitana TaxID=1936003 RepID=A0A1U9NPY3_9BACT|nr:radical SAM protein [Anaerohalosphaera lusitana]AQT69670.1 7-carboxy-7-deazaguanine synthase [Anaerohalosphaera lusitana]